MREIRRLGKYSFLSRFLSLLCDPAKVIARGELTPPYARRRAAGDSSPERSSSATLGWIGGRESSSSPYVCEYSEVLPLVAPGVVRGSSRP